MEEPLNPVRSSADVGEGSKPRVSVILVFLNGAEFIGEAITSVMTQTMDDFELLLCDDGSSDGSTEIARERAARHPAKVRYLEHPGHANKGASPTRNLGLCAARGEYVAFIDVDDVWRQKKLAEQTAIMTANPDVGLVCGTVRYWGSWNGGEDVLVPTGHVRNRVVRPPEASLALYPLGRAAAPCPSDILVRRDVVEAVGGFEEEFTGSRQLYEDQAFLSKLYLATPVFFSESVWLDYRQHADSCVASVNRDGLYGDVRLFFLNWFEDYLSRVPSASTAAVRPALRRALRPYRSPVVHALVSSPARLLARGPGAVRRIDDAVRAGVRRLSSPDAH
jgi:glycosyltransferase involved in cell wall biosynthesis